MNGSSNEKLVTQLRGLAAKSIIIANCTSAYCVERLRAAGAAHVFRAATEVALGILPALNAKLSSYHAGLYEQHWPLESPEVLD